MRRSPDEGVAADVGVEVVLRVADVGTGEGKVLGVLFVVGSIGACVAGVVAGGRASDVG